MKRGLHLKPNLDTIAVFGSNSRIGRPLARYVAANSPKTTLRLIIRSERHRDDLAKEFSNADVVVASYYDLPSMEKALRGANGIFVVTPDFLDEERAMTNLVHAARRNLDLIHIVRILADPPGMSMDRVPEVLRKFGGGTAVQHLRARKVLEASGLPITYVNIAAYFMQNFSAPLFNKPLRQKRTLVCPRNRRMGFIDTCDIGNSCAAILLSLDHRHIGQTYHLDNGHDVMWFDEVAELMSEVWGEEIAFDDSDETFINITGEVFKKAFGRPDATEYFIGYSQFEQDNETVWRKSDIVEYLTGSKAKTLSEWLRENKDDILGLH